MTDRAAMLAAILADPADDTVRLAFADWLEEEGEESNCERCRGTGGPLEFHSYDSSLAVCKECSGSGRVSNGNRERAEFIRVQIELAAVYPPEPFQWHWPEDRAVLIHGEPPKFSIGTFLAPGFPELHPGQCLEDGWVDFHFRGKVWRDLYFYIDPPDAPIGSLVHARFKPHPKGAYPHRECVASLRRRERELLNSHWVEWCGHGPKVFEDVPTFSRGFVSSISCTWDAWRTHADAICARQPIERVRLTTPTGIDYFDSDGQLLWFPGWDKGPVVDRDDLPRVEGDSCEQAVLRMLWPKIAFELPPEPTEPFAGVTSFADWVATIDRYLDAPEVTELFR